MNLLFPTKFKIQNTNYPLVSLLQALKISSRHRRSSKTPSKTLVAAHHRMPLVTQEMMFRAAVAVYGGSSHSEPSQSLNYHVAQQSNGVQERLAASWVLPGKKQESHLSRV